MLYCIYWYFDSCKVLTCATQVEVDITELLVLVRGLPRPASNRLLLRIANKMGNRHLGLVDAGGDLCYNKIYGCIRLVARLSQQQG